MGGSLRGESLGIRRGATFTLELPVASTALHEQHHRLRRPPITRILIIDDNPAIHEDFRKILSPVDSLPQGSLKRTEAALFGETHGNTRELTFQVDSAFQGQEGLEKVRAAFAAGEPYAVAFVDVRMPPGWDGIETISRIWEEFPDLQIVICTAYSDYSWDEISQSRSATPISACS